MESGVVKVDPQKEARKKLEGIEVKVDHQKEARKSSRFCNLMNSDCRRCLYL